MKGLSRIFSIIIVVACTVTGCSPPIGSIGGDKGADFAEEGEGLTAVPKRTAYSIPDQKFQRDIDLTVFISYRSVLHTVPIDLVEISIIEDLSQPNIKNSIEPGEIYPFESEGPKGIVVEYNNLSDMYYVDVIDPFDMGSGGNGNSDAPGIQVIWDY